MQQDDNVLDTVVQQCIGAIFRHCSTTMYWSYFQTLCYFTLLSKNICAICSSTTMYYTQQYNNVLDTVLHTVVPQCIGAIFRHCSTTMYWTMYYTLQYHNVLELFLDTVLALYSIIQDGDFFFENFEKFYKKIFLKENFFLRKFFQDGF